MALKKCIECNKDIGGKVKKCPHCGTDQRKWYDQHPVLTIFGALFLFGIIVNIINPSRSSNPIPTDPVTEIVNTVVDDNNTTMSKSEFDQIQTGMTYEQVVAITGCQGTVEAESGTPGTELHTISYGWKGHGSIGANANTMFQGGKLINKAQLGLN